MTDPTRRSLLQAGLLGAGALAVTNSATASAQQKDSAKPSVATGYDYRRPKFKEGARLLFQGDSITDMNWGRNEKDRNHYLGHSYVFLIAARLGVDLPGAKLEFFNRGISGNTVADLKARWTKDAVEMRPDVLSILIGINDVGRTGGAVKFDAWEADYRQLLEASRKANPQLQLVLLDPFVLKVGVREPEAVWTPWRAAVDKLGTIVAKLAADFQAVHIQTQQIFDASSTEVDPAHWIWDGVHPLPAGHELIARHWLQAVSG